MGTLQHTYLYVYVGAVVEVSLCVIILFDVTGIRSQRGLGLLCYFSRGRGEYSLSCVPLLGAGFAKIVCKVFEIRAQEGFSEILGSGSGFWGGWRGRNWVYRRSFLGYA